MLECAVFCENDVLQNSPFFNSAQAHSMWILFIMLALGIIISSALLLLKTAHIPQPPTQPQSPAHDNEHR